MNWKNVLGLGDRREAVLGFFFLAAPIVMAAVAAVTAAATVFKAVSDKKAADDEAKQLRLNAALEDTKALQRDTIRRQELEQTVSAIRAIRGDQGDNSPTALSFIDEANENISSDRQIELANSAQRAADLRAQARSARARGRRSLISGSVSAGLSLFQAASNFGGSGLTSKAGSSFSKVI